MTQNIIPISNDDLELIQGILNSGNDLFQAYDLILPYLEEGTRDWRGARY